ASKTKTRNKKNHKKNEYAKNTHEASSPLTAAQPHKAPRKQENKVIITVQPSPPTGEERH
ncbi:hypothetical protein, partial [Xylella fastidiosa]|uniref:hypothetical protein n=1 Tax=Xylella fastidiosa TaxID=2371 RepID=UPI001E4D4D83